MVASLGRARRIVGLKTRARIGHGCIGRQFCGESSSYEELRPVRHIDFSKTP